MTQQSESIFSAWHLYQKVIANNYMYHAQIATVLATTLQEHLMADGAAPRLLDLGCGDAQIPLQLMKNTTVSHYHGVDTSENALATARTGLQKIAQLNFTLACEPLLDFVLTCDATFDVVLAGFSLHHYTEADKGRFFAAVSDRLAGDGCLLVYDIFCEHEELRADYLGRYMRWASSTWTQLSAAEMQLVDEHVHRKDYPSSSQQFMIAGMAAGFDEVTELWRDASGFHRLLVFR